MGARWLKVKGALSAARVLALALLALSATTSSAADHQAPTAPTGFTATVLSSSQINLSWTASTDNVGVTGYLVERCQGSGCTSFAQVATLTATNFSDTGLAAATSYSYRVRARDAAGNLSGYSNIASGTTQAAADTTAPTAPMGLGVTAWSESQITLSWTASTDNVGVTGYRVERCQGTGCTTFVFVVSLWPSPTSFTDTRRGPGTSYSYRVQARDAAGNLSGYSNIASVTTLGSPDTIPPTAPEGLTANGWSASDITLSWAASTDNVGVTGYHVERCQGTGCTTFVEIFVTGWTSTGNSGLTAATSYSYRVRAADATGNLSGYSNIVSVTTLATSDPDTTRPTAPAGLTAAAVSASQITLNWTASTDNVGVANYYVVRCQGAGCTFFFTVAVVEPTKTSFIDTGLSAATSYSYKVRAADAVEYSAFSNVASATTGAAAAAQVYYIHPDHLNTPRLIANQAGTTVWRWDQTEPFGSTPPNDDPDGDGVRFDFLLRFPGQYFDRETNLAYNYFRDYDPAIGRYVESDPIGLQGGLNLYAYALNNPLRYTDPLGLDVTMTCRPVAAFGAVGMSSPVHCAVIVWHYDQCGRKVIDTQYSVAGGGTSPTRDPTDPTFAADRRAFGSGAGNSPIPATTGMSQSDWDRAVTNSGNNYSQGPYFPVPGPNSNTAAGNIITNAGGTVPNVPGAWGMGYQPFTGGSIGDIIAP